MSAASFANIFSHSESCLFVLFMVSFAVQKFLSLLRSHLFIFVLIFFTVGSGLKKILLWFMSKSVLPTFPSKSFIVSGPTFRSLFYFIFVCGTRECSSFICLHVAVIFPAPLIKEIAFSPLYKTLRGKHRQILSGINHSRIFYDQYPRIMEIKTKINKWDLIKLKSFYTMKKTINKVKRPNSEWEKIIANKQLTKN